MGKIHVLRAIPHLLAVFLKYKITGRLVPFSAAIDVTSACNLRCKHCYIYRHEKEKFSMNKLEQMSGEDWLARIKQLRKDNPHIIHMSWVGGEPTLRKDLLREGTKYFPLNWIVTNGTIPFPENLSNATAFAVSLDGPELYHDDIRGKGVFRKAIQNIEQSSRCVFAHSVINKLNRTGMGKLVEQLQGTKIKGIRFSLYTPARNIKDKLTLTVAERDSVVRLLLKLKEKYGKFILMSNLEIKALSSDMRKIVFGDNCILKKGADMSLDYQGNQKLPCVMGPKADCDNCGCTIPTMLYAASKFDFETLAAIAKTFLD